MNKPTVVAYSPDLRAESGALPARFQQILDEKAGKDFWCLDLGTGKGTVAFYLADKVRWILGLDKRSKPIEDARRKAQNQGIVNIQFMVADVEQTLLAEMSPVGKFQLITSNMFLSRKTLELCSKAVATKGSFVCSCFDTLQWHETGKVSSHAFEETELKNLLKTNELELEEFQTLTTEYQFESLDQVKEFLPTRLYERWQEDGRWQGLKQSFEAGQKSLTQSIHILSALKSK